MTTPDIIRIVAEILQMCATADSTGIGNLSTSYVRACCEQLRESIAQQPSNAVPDGWKSIDSAPKDGSWIVVGWACDGGALSVRWSREHNDWIDADCSIGFHYPPTHWISRPAAAQEQP